MATLTDTEKQEIAELVYDLIIQGTNNSIEYSNTPMTVPETDEERLKYHLGVIYENGESQEAGEMSIKDIMDSFADSLKTVLDNYVSDSINPQLDNKVSQAQSAKTDAQTAEANSESLLSQIQALKTQIESITQKQVVAPIELEGQLYGYSLAITNGEPYMVISEIDTTTAEEATA